MAGHRRLSSCCLLLATLLAAGALAASAFDHGARFARIPRRAAVQKPPKPLPRPEPKPKPEPRPRPRPRPRPLPRPRPEPKPKSSAVKVGPWGPRYGTPFDISKSSEPHHLENITMRSYGGRIIGFSFVYVDVKGQPITVSTWGSSTKGYEYTCAQITMRQDEYVKKVSGTFDQIGVTSLVFVTNTRVEYGTGCGSPSGAAFSVPLQQGNGEALSFFGLSGDSLVALGTYVAPRA